MDTSPWIRTRDIPSYYSISKTKAYELVREMRKKCSPDGFIDDEKIHLIRKDAFEAFWRNRINGSI